MNSLAQSIARNAVRMNAARRLSTYQPKLAWKVWLGDTGAYPIMAITTMYLGMALFATIYIPTHTDDMRIYKSSRKTLFRGELYGADLTLDEHHNTVQS